MDLMKKAQVTSLVYVSKQMKHFLNNFFFFLAIVYSCLMWESQFLD